jgi:hypothetical protein
VFYEVNFDEETRILFEGQASGAISKGGGGMGKNFIPDDALDNSLDLIRQVATKLATEVAPTLDGTLCSVELTFSVRADGNGTVMIAQDPSLGQFRVTLKRPVIKRTGGPTAVARKG